MKNHFIMQKIKRYVQEKEEISMQIKCDKCSAVSESIMPETYLEGDIEVYPVCATDSALRADIAEYTRMRNLIRVKPVKESFIRRAEALKQKNLKRSQELMETHPLAPFLTE